MLPIVEDWSLVPKMACRLYEESPIWNNRTHVMDNWADWDKKWTAGNRAVIANVLEECLADERGAVIESVVARLHRHVESRQRQTRIVGLSATLPNYQDVAQFLQVPDRGMFFFGPEHFQTTPAQHICFANS